MWGTLSTMKFPLCQLVLQHPKRFTMPKESSNLLLQQIQVLGNDQFDTKKLTSLIPNSMVFDMGHYALIVRKTLYLLYNEIIAQHKYNNYKFLWDD